MNLPAAGALEECLPVGAAEEAAATEISVLVGAMSFGKEVTFVDFGRCFNKGLAGL